ncbi:MAG: ABC transporter permease [Deltaproteobacteria bacterium]
MKKSANIGLSIAPWLAFIILLAGWEAGVRIWSVPLWILPAPSQVLRMTLSSLPLLLGHTVVTLEEAILGFAASVALAFLLVFCFNLMPWLRQALYPLLVVSQTIPLITLAVLFTIWFGWGLLPKVLVVILVCFFPIVISLIKGIDGVHPEMIDLFRSMGASRLKIWTMVQFPLALPSFFAGLRISATYSIMAAVIGEWMGSQQGLGFYMTLLQKNFSVDGVLSAVLIICLLSLLLVKTVDFLEYVLVPWGHRRSYNN